MINLHGNKILLGVLLLALAGCDTMPDSSSQSAAVSGQGRYIVQFNNASNGKAAVSAAGGQVALDLPGHNAAAVYLPSAAVTALSNNPAIALLEEDAKRYPSAETTPYGITMVQADQLSDSNGAAVTVCIIDSGVDGTHDDLPVGNMSGSADQAGYWNTDGCQHGTHVAGTIAAVGNNATGVVGVNPGGTLGLHIVKVFADDCGWTYASGLIGALEECENAGAKVVSMSLGGGGRSKFEDNAFAAAYGRGVLSIAAAGNDGNTRKSFPASYASVMSVAAVDSGMALASFSQRNADVEIAAPGVDVKSTVPMGTGSSTTVTVNAVDYDSNAMEESPQGTATGALALCDESGQNCGSAGGHVCLIPRGTYSFSDKILGCEATGGVAAIVYNNEAGPLLGTLAGVATTIPSVGVSAVDGAAMATAVGTSATVALTADNYAYFNGTSMATPHVSGVAALVWSHNTSWTNQEIRDALNATAIDLGDAGRDNSFGYGLVQAADALAYLQSSGPVCTPTESSETSCGDGVDNDCDGDTDGADSDCSSSCTPTESSETSCGDGLDNDCDGATDGADSDCQSNTCELAQIGEGCNVDGDCCSSKCKGRSGAKTCK